MNRDVITWLTFLSIISVVVLALNLYIGLRLTGVLPRPSPWRPVVWLLMIGFAGVVLVSPLLKLFSSYLGETFSRIVVLIGYSYLGLVVVMTILLFFFDFLFFVYYLLAKFSYFNNLVSEERRLVIFGYAPWAAVALTGLMSARGFQVAVAGPSIKPVKITKKNLHQGLHGLKMAQISDLHVSSTIRRDYVQDVVDKTMAEKPDVILITGDLVDGSYKNLKEDVEPLRQLSAPLGVYYTTGNHEYYWGHDDWEKVFQSFGFRVLHNDFQKIGVNGGVLRVGGVPDFACEGVGLCPIDASKALAGSINDDFVVFMVHQPKGYKLIKDNHCDLQVSGHTHAGQFFPASLFIDLFHRYAKGLYRHENKFWVYVNPGTGYWGPVNRLGVPAEITMFTLEPHV